MQGISTGLFVPSGPECSSNAYSSFISKVKPVLPPSAFLFVVIMINSTLLTGHCTRCLSIIVNHVRWYCTSITLTAVLGWCDDECNALSNDWWRMCSTLSQVLLTILFTLRTIYWIHFIRIWPRKRMGNNRKRTCTDAPENVLA